MVRLLYTSVRPQNMLKNTFASVSVIFLDNDFANTDDLWKEEVDSLRRICDINGIDALVERSRSGRGAHLWIFFQKPIEAELARKFGNAPGNPDILSYFP